VGNLLALSFIGFSDGVKRVGKLATEIIAGWPEQSREAAQLVIAQRGEPDESTSTQLTWHNRAP
jgi:hypothetical protein